MNNPSSKILGIIFAIIFLSSCGKKLVYFQQKENSKNTPEQIKLAQAPDPAAHVLSAGDVLQFDYFNRSPEINEQFASLKSEIGKNLSGLAIDDQGSVFLPVFGNIKLADLTVAQAEKILIDSFNKYYTDYNFSLKLIGIRVTMLGAIGTKGVMIVPGPNPTIIDAIALGGDLGGVGNPTNIKIIRHNGQNRKTILIDLGDIDIFKSEGYYLQSNDLIYIETQKRLFVRENLQYISIAASLVNLFTVIIIQLRQ